MTVNLVAVEMVAGGCRCGRDKAASSFSCARAETEVGKRETASRGHSLKSAFAFRDTCVGMDRQPLS